MSATTAIVGSVALVLTAPSLAEQSAPAANGMVWSTLATCRTPSRVRVSVTYDRAVVYRGVVALCRVAPQALQADKPSRPGRFMFLGNPHDFAPSLPEGRRSIEGRVWEANATTDGISLGISFTVPGQVLLNTTHAVPATTRTENTLASTLTITTEPPAPR